MCLLYNWMIINGYCDSEDRQKHGSDITEHLLEYSV